MISYVQAVFLFHLTFWDALTAVGTVGAVVAALIIPKVSKKQENESTVKQAMSNIHNEVLINFDQLSYNSLNSRDFVLSTEQFDLLQKSTYLLNIEA